MKKLLLLALLSVFTGFTMLAEKNVVSKGDTQGPLGKFVIEKTSDFVEINGVALPTYIITYQNSDKVIRVAVDINKKSKTKNYIVLGDDLNLQYTCQLYHFGAKKLDKEYVKAGITNSIDNLNNGEYFHQKILTCSDPDKRDCLGLIACYYPLLIKDYENAFACKR